MGFSARFNDVSFPVIGYRRQDIRFSCMDHLAQHRLNLLFLSTMVLLMIFFLTWFFFFFFAGHVFRTETPLTLLYQLD